METHQFHNDQVQAYFDDNNHIAYIRYRGVLRADTALEVYQWLEDLYDEIGIEGFCGQIFDFRAVTEFDEGNLKTARRTSNRLNMKQDNSQVPVALLVGTHYHEEILRTAMRISPDHLRKKIVWSEDEALDYLDAFQQEHKAPDS